MLRMVIPGLISRLECGENYSVLCVVSMTNDAFSYWVASLLVYILGFLFTSNL